MSQPTHLEKPGFGQNIPKVVKVGALPVVVIGVLFVFLMFTFIYSVESGKKADIEQRKEREKQSIASAAENIETSTPLVPEIEQKAGIAEEAEPETAPEPDPIPPQIPPVDMVVTRNNDPVVQARERELQNIQRYRMQQQQQALTSGLRVQLNTVHRQPSAQTANGVATPDELAAWRAGYRNEVDAAVDAAHQIPGGGPSGESMESDRQEKERFFSRAGKRDDEWILPYTRERGSRFELKTGSIIPGIMITGVNSDLPGQIIGQVSQNVFDTATGNYLLIPQGSRMIGQYDARVSMGQQRVLIAWNRVIFPDGSSITLGAMPGTDMAGNSGLEDEVDNHYLKIFGSAAIMSMISGGMAYAADKFDSSDDDDSSVQGSFGSALSSGLGQSTLNLLQRNAAMKPTLEIRPGYRFNMIAVRDLEFSEPYSAWR